MLPRYWIVCLLALGRMAPAEATAQQPARLVTMLEARLLERGMVATPKLARTVATGAAALYTVNLAVVAVAQPSLPLAEKARVAAELMGSPEAAAGIGGFVVGDLGTEAALRQGGVSLPRVIHLAATPAVGELAAEIALEVMEELRLERRVLELSLEELRLFAGGDLEKYQRLREAHERYLVAGGSEALLRTLTGGGVDYGRSLAAGGGWAVGALAGGAVAGPLGALGGGLGGAVGVGAGYERLRELFQDEGELRAEAEMLAAGGALDPEDASACQPGSGADTLSCAAWVRARRAARRNLLAWGAEGLARVVAEYQLALTRSRTRYQAELWTEELGAVVAWNRLPADTRGEPPPHTHGVPFHGLRLGLARTGWALRQLDHHWEREHREAGPQALRNAGFSDELRLVVAASRRADRKLIRKLRERYEATLGVLDGAPIEAHQLPLASATSDPGDPYSAGVWGIP